MGNGKNKPVVIDTDPQWMTSLVEDCKAIITEAVFTSRWALVEGYHGLGERIVTDGNFKKSAKGNHSSLTDLSKKSGIGERDLYRAVAFYNKYPSLDDVPEGKNITWNKIITKYLPEPKPKVEPRGNIATDTYDLRVCSCTELFESGIKPDAVITDPPYPVEFLHVFSELAASCSIAKVPLVAVMSGQSYLPEVMRRLCEHLAYRWTMAYLTPGGQSVQQWPAKVNTFWKPVFLFGDAIDWIGDVCKSAVNDNDKRFHDWGQSESGISDLVERLTVPGQLICDPFLGGGTTAIVSIALGRRFVGCDIDAVAVETTRQRIEKSTC